MQAAARGAKLEGLLDEVDRALAEGAVAMHAVVVGRAEDQLAVWLLRTDAVGHLEAVDVRQVEVEDGELECHPSDQSQRLLTGLCEGHLRMGIGQQLTDQPQVLGHVVQHEYPVAPHPGTTRVINALRQDAAP